MPRDMNAIRSMGGHSSKLQWEERNNVLDGFHTPRVAVETLMDRVRLAPHVWEPAAGFHRISSVLRERERRVFTSDVYDWNPRIHEIRDFRDFRGPPPQFGGRPFDVVTNPPFKLAAEFALHALRLLQPGRTLALLLRLQFLEGSDRHRTLFSVHPPRVVFAYSFRLPRMHRFGYRGEKKGSAIAFAWFVWQKGWEGETTIRWIPRPE